MIKIKESHLPNTIILSQQEKYIGLSGSNNFTTRTFVFERVFNGLDLNSDLYVVLLQVKPVNETEDAFFIPLEKVYIEELDQVHYSFKITRELTKDRGTLRCNLKITSVDENNDIEGYTYFVSFEVLDNIDATKPLEKLDRNILDQLVTQSAAHAQNAKTEADRAKSEADKIIGLIADGEIDLAVALEEDVQVAGVSAGNISDGDLLEEGLSFTDFVKKMFIKRIPPVYVSPTLNISALENKSVEVGSIINTTIDPIFNQNDAGEIESYSLSQNGVNIFTNLTTQSFNVPPFSVGDEAVKFVAQCTYGEGLVRNDNLNEPYPDGMILAGTILSNEIVFSGYRNAFYGSDDIGMPMTTSDEIRGLGGKLLNAVNGSVFVINVPAGHRRIYIAYPSTLRDLEQVSYVEQGSASYVDIFSANKILINVNGVNGYAPILYKVYSWIPAIPFTSNMTLNITI